MHRAKILAAAALVTALGATPALADEIDQTATTTPNEPVAVEVANTNEATTTETPSVETPSVKEDLAKEAPETPEATTNAANETLETPEAAKDQATAPETEDASEGVFSSATSEIEDFVTRMYTICLGREESAIDKAGFDVQVAAMKSGTSAAQIAMNFFTSEEFTNRQLSNSDIVETVYKTMFDRAADAEGAALWEGYLNNNMSVAAVVKGFSQSEEYANNCEKWGVTAGSVDVTEARDQDAKITEFVWGLYSECLGRTVADIEGLNVQCQALLDGTSGSQLARNFFGSEEYDNRNLTHTAMVETVYETMLGRASDVDGAAFWRDHLDSCMSIDAVVCGFSQAPEWIQHCADYGITSEQLSPENARDKDIDITKFVQKLFQGALQRDPDAAEANERCQYLLDDRAAASMVIGVYESDEHRALNMSSLDIIKGIFNTMVGHEPSSTDIAAWTGYLTNPDDPKTAADMAESVSKTNEFKDTCKKLGIKCGYARDPYDGAYQNITSTTNCFILIDCTNNKLVIYEGSQNNWEATHTWTCSTGAPGSDTVKGTYTVTGLRGEYFDDAWGDRCWYWTQFYGDYLIHSVLYEIEGAPNTIKDGTLGANVSHGCVRLSLENAEWIYKWVPTESTVFIF